jgi:hypothetical protein
MATQGPMMRDTQTVAAANYWNPTTLLYGPAGSGQFLCMVTSGNRVSSIQTAAGGRIDGILQNTPDINQACDICRNGVTKAVAGAAIVVATEARLVCDTNGRVITWTATGNKQIVGVALENAGAAGDVIAVLINAPSYASAT